jgi:sigma-B regulation protein RsbU (phosphoserine phosphatase)
MPVKILVVDDEPDMELVIRQKFRRQIREGEMTFVFASHGKHALERLQADPDIDLVLTDINMPEMDGLTLLSRIAETERLLRSVVVSAYGDLRNIRTAMNRGAFDFVTKPIDFEDLELTIRRTWRELQAYKRAAEGQKQLTSLQHELDVARRIQEAALPRTFPRAEGWAFSASMVPAREVGGDFYDLFAIDDERIGLCIGDVSGKGVSAAMFMSVTRTLIKAIALRGEPAEACIRTVNRLLYPESLPEMFVTAFYGILHRGTGELEYCNAGHNPPFVLRPGTPAPLERTGGVALCLVKDFPYRSRRVRLVPGDGLFLFTDGVTEAMNGARELFTDARLQTALEGAEGLAPADVIRQVLRAVAAFVEGAPPSDDLTTLALRHRNGDPA